MIVWNPFKEISRIEKDIDKSFRKFFHHNEKYYIKTRGLMKALGTFKSKGNNFEINIKLPGVSKKDIIVKAHDRVLEVKAKKSHKMEINKTGLFKKKRTFGSFYRVIPMPNGVDVSKLKSEFKNGSLKITIPKKKIMKKHRVVKVY